MVEEAVLLISSTIGYDSCLVMVDEVSRFFYRWKCKLVVLFTFLFLFMNFVFHTVNNLTTPCDKSRSSTAFNLFHLLP